EFYVVAFGWHAVLAFSRAHPDREFRKAIAAGFMPDNIHWDNGRLIAAGMKLDEPACGGVRKVIDGKADGMRCHRGYVVAELEPHTMSFKVVAYAEPNPHFNGVSAAVAVDNELWRLGIELPRKRLIRQTFSGAAAEVTPRGTPKICLLR